MSNVVTLPTRETVAEAWDRYVELIHRQQADTRLLADVEHQMAVVRAYERWRDLYLAWAA